MQFYRRNYIEGLFLSSGIFKNADYTMERLVQVAKTLRSGNDLMVIFTKPSPVRPKNCFTRRGYTIV